jgi:hypothetical protein
MPDTVRIGLLHSLAKPVGDGIYVVALELVAFQHKAVPTHFEPGIRLKIKLSNLPEPFLKAIEIVVATDAVIQLHTVNCNRA